MGFFKKFFSIGHSKKSKKRGSVPRHFEQEPQQQPREEDTEAAVSRLLRSSSARCGAESGLNYASLPPLPHPINSLLPNPAASTATISSTSQRSTYTVTVLGRTVHSRTEFPNAYPTESLSTPKRNINDSTRRRYKSVPVTPRDQNRLLRLRQDPSVASLLNIYDDNGCLDSHAFSNTPPVTGHKRRQTRRSTGSTFRQLLGNPSSPELRGNSDIEWAENVLDETDDNSSACSFDLKTPRDPHFPSPHFNHADHSITLSTQCDTSVKNQYTFSSLEVELSASSENSHRVLDNSPYGNPNTPQRASQIFSFLADKKMALEERPSRLPTRKIILPLHTLSDLAPTNAQHPHILLSDTRSCEPPAETTFFSSSQSEPAAREELANAIAHEELKPVTTDHTGQSSRGPRGPRALSKSPSQTKSHPTQPSLQDDLPPVPHLNVQGTSSRPAFGEKSNADERYPCFATFGEDAAPSKSPFTSRRLSSQRSKVVDLNADSQLPTLARSGLSLHTFASAPSSLAKNKSKAKSPSSTHSPPQDKENEHISRLPQPKTPIRPLSSRQSYLQEQPSPALSIELSPVGTQIMTNLRQQRMQARQKERQSGRRTGGSSHSRIRN